MATPAPWTVRTRASALLLAFFLIGPAPLALGGGKPGPGLTADFAVSCSPASQSIEAGSSGARTCTATSQAGFAAPVTFDCFGQSPGFTCTFAPNPVDVPSGGSASSTLTLSVSPTTSPGTYNFHVRGTSGSLQRFFVITTTVTPGPGSGDFSVACSPNSFTTPAPATLASTCTVSSTGGFSLPVALDCMGEPGGITCSFSPATVTPPPNGSATSALTINVAAGTPPGFYGFNVRGMAGATQRFASIFIAVTSGGGGGGDFSVSCDPNVLAATSPGSATSTCTVASSGTFSSPVTLSCTTPTPAVTCSFAPSMVTPPAGGSVTSVLTVNVGAGIPRGSIVFFAVNGVSGPATRQAQMVLLIQ